MADLKTIKTPRGATMSIHSGAQVTTNVHHSGWLVITDQATLNLLQQMQQADKKGDASTVQNIYNQINQMSVSAIGYPYRRGAGGGPTPKVATSTNDATSTNEEPTPTPELTIDELRYQTTQKVLNFFSEFDFKPAARFINTLTHQDKDQMNEYVKNYFALCDHPDKNAIVEKIKSYEWDQILNDLKQCESDKYINNRLSIYYGPAGTGKTTKAISEYPEAAVIACSSNMEPVDLLKTFKFDNGKTTFEKSELRLAMENGKPVILDEINLLRLDCIRFLQTLLDNKSYIDFEGERINIQDGFEIIGTMNLVVNGQVFFLPEPIVDRAKKLDGFELEARLLSSMVF